MKNYVTLLFCLCMLISVGNTQAISDWSLAPINGTDPSLEYSHYSSNLLQGDNYTWIFTTFDVNGIAKTSSTQGYPSQNSLLHIDVIRDPSQIDFTNKTLNLEEYFNMYIDDFQIPISEHLHEFSQLIYPFNVELKNETNYNFIRYVFAHNQAIFPQYSHVGYGTGGGTVYLELKNDGNADLNNIEIEYYSSTGVLMHYLNDGGFSFKFQIDLLGSEYAPKPSVTKRYGKDNTGTKLNLPGISWSWVSSTLGIILLARRYGVKKIY